MPALQPIKRTKKRQAFDICVIVIAPVSRIDPSITAQTFNLLASIPLFATFACTVLCTSLIVYRIRSFSIEGSLRRRYRHIVEILVESSALYSVVVLPVAILFPVQSIPSSFQSFATLNTVAVYLGAFYNYITFSTFQDGPFHYIQGIAPTIMIARVALSRDRDSNSTYMIGSGPPMFKSTTPSSTSALPQDMA
ncbi:hypothetical protein CVT26_000284 [Gymnopilus dilepis]|uniref:Uncharacterized protein n=1 Tax=Gymnopilus dilepis TaxID=231916 RepID=A0A409WBK0_9AGAR|nr:hypothetical protein CVT26_000284 [Gymnopilus dilepis]